MPVNFHIKSCSVTFFQRTLHEIMQCIQSISTSCGSDSHLFLTFPLLFPKILWPADRHFCDFFYHFFGVWSRTVTQRHPYPNHPQHPQPTFPYVPKESLATCFFMRIHSLQRCLWYGCLPWKLIGLPCSRKARRPWIQIMIYDFNTCQSRYCFLDYW